MTGGEAIVIYTWYSTPKVVLALWRMAKVQHKFSKGKSCNSIVRKNNFHIDGKIGVELKLAAVWWWFAKVKCVKYISICIR